MKKPRSYGYSSISLWFDSKKNKIMTANHNSYVHPIPPSEIKRLKKFIDDCEVYINSKKKDV